MADKLQFFSVTVFATDDYNGQQKQMEVLLPVEAISHLTQLEPGVPQRGYSVHIKKNYQFDVPFKVKSYSLRFLSSGQVELLK